MSFTVEVKRKEREKGFGFEDLEMSHRECYGGEIKMEACIRDEGGFESEGHIADICEGDIPGWRLTCQRCRQTRFVSVEPDGLKFLKVAMDGQERRAKRDVIIQGGKNGRI